MTAHLVESSDAVARFLTSYRISRQMKAPQKVDPPDPDFIAPFGCRGAGRGIHAAYDQTLIRLEAPPASSPLTPAPTTRLARCCSIRPTNAEAVAAIDAPVPEGHRLTWLRRSEPRT